MGALSPEASKEDFWWLKNFPPEIDINNYGK
jgi:hypothetical protein